MEHDMTINTVIFDLDGTLINSIEDVTYALNQMLDKYHLEAVSAHETLHFIGNGARTLIDKVFAAKGLHLTNKQANSAVEIYLENYKLKPVKKTKLFPGVIETLTTLKRHQVHMGICTNKPAQITHLILKKLKIHSFFSAVVAGDESKSPKPDQEHLHEVLKKLKVKNIQAVMVGDSEIDMACADQAGVPFIGVTYGYGKLNTKYLMHHFSELLNTMRKI